MNFNSKANKGSSNQKKSMKFINKKPLAFKTFNYLKIKKNLSSSKEKLGLSNSKNKINVKNNATKMKHLFVGKINVQKKLDAFELNNLEFEEAIKLDKRSFLKIYWDILCREHKIIFTFFIFNDYNLLYVKYARFIFLVATDMAMNVFFFSDDSMHKIFLNYGKYNFIQQIPQIVYTTIISQLMEIFLCFLSLTDKHIYGIKNSSN